MIFSGIVLKNITFETKFLLCNQIKQIIQFVSINQKLLDCSQPLYLAHTKEMRAKRVGVGVGFALPPCQVFRLALASSSRVPIRAFNDQIKI